MPDLRELLKIRNHAETRRILVELADGGPLPWYDDAVRDQSALWMALAREHLEAARSLARVTGGRSWRSVVSRSYYAAYNASRAVRYRVKGYVKSGADDHREATELPDDFPDLLRWQAWLTALRDARNQCDYDPWADVQSKLFVAPNECAQGAEEFVEAEAKYLGSREVMA